MIDPTMNRFQPVNDDSNDGKFSKELFEKIKALQSLPDDIVVNFLKSKGKLKKKPAAINYRADEKQN
jgi:hypothetical protein